MTEQSAVTVDPEMVGARLAEILAGMVGSAADEITDDTRLFEELGLDSTNALELLMTIEDEFGIEFDPGALELKHLESVRTLTAYLSEQAGL